jgi:hypothetical protein
MCHHATASREQGNLAISDGRESGSRLGLPSCRSGHPHYADTEPNSMGIGPDRMLVHTRRSIDVDSKPNCRGRVPPRACCRSGTCRAAATTSTDPSAPSFGMDRGPRGSAFDRARSRDATCSPCQKAAASSPACPRELPLLPYVLSLRASTRWARRTFQLTLGVTKSNAFPSTTKASSVGLPTELLRWELYSQMAGRLSG